MRGERNEGRDLAGEAGSVRWDEAGSMTSLESPTFVTLVPLVVKSSGRSEFFQNVPGFVSHFAEFVGGFGDRYRNGLCQTSR